MKTIIFALLAVFTGSAFASTHSVFVCQSSDTTAAKGIYMFAFDSQGQDTNGKKSGFCQFTVDNNGKAFGQYFCWVGDTETAKTTDGQLAIQFVQPLGDNVKSVRLLNLPESLLQDRGGSGLMRILSRPSKDLTPPIRPRQSDVDSIDCKLENVDFAD